MATTVFVKVVGFRDVERHALNTIFRLSMERPTCYTLWTPDAPVMPHVALIDVESYEAGLALASPGLNRNLKLICVGAGAPDHAWRVFSRPLNWTAVLHAMDQLFAQMGVDINLDLEGEGTSIMPPGVRLTLLVDPAREERLYLRARLSLAGLIEVDEVDSVAHAQAKIRERHYDVVIVDVDSPDDPWALVERLVAFDPPIGSVLITTSNNSWKMHERAEQAGCRAVLEKPYDPSHVFRVLQMV
ncbi:MAG: response regulator [Burkholderiaceae bacterium]